MIDQIKTYLNAPAAERDVAAGALLLLKLNRNRVLYNGACIAPKRYAPVIEHELKKHLRILLDGQTAQGIVEMEHEVVPVAKESLDEGAPVVSTDVDHPEGTYRGCRADHNELPEEIRALYEKNGEIYFKMKQTFETLKTLEDAAPCDRYEHLKVLKSLDEQYRRNWKKYDEYKR